MIIPIDQFSRAWREQTGSMLHELGFPAHRIGYKQLCIAIPRYAQDSTQSIIKELYPYIAVIFGYTGWCAVEHAMRCAIHDAWFNCDPDIWEEYFPNSRKPPSNKLFIATLAERLE